VKKLIGKNLTLYERIEEMEKWHTSQIDKVVSQASQASQDAPSLCNDLDYLWDALGTPCVPQCPKGQEPPDPVPMSIVISDAELISRSLEYLNGIIEPLSGWSLWKRIEQGKEHRFAIDAAGVIRWERWYSSTVPGPMPEHGLIPESSPIPEPIPACYACHERRWWVSIYGVRICGVCHPPAKEKLVKEWV